MSILNIYIVEDEPLYAGQLEVLVDQLGYQLAGISDNSDQALKEIIRLQPDLLLMDINIEGSMNGIELVSQVQKQRNIPTIFVTSFKDRETFYETKKLKPFAYIVKPFDGPELERSIELALANGTGMSKVSAGQEAEEESLMVMDQAVFVKVGRRIEKVRIEDILYCEVDNNYTTIFTTDGKKYVVRLNLDHLNEQLPQKVLKRIHRKYSINLKNMTSIDLTELSVTVGNIELPIGRSYKDPLLEALKLLK